MNGSSSISESEPANHALLPGKRRLDSSPTTSLRDGYLGTHTGHRATPTTSSPDYRPRPPRSDKYKRLLFKSTRCVDIVCWFETRYQLIEMTTVIRSEPVPGERGTSLEATTTRCRRRVEKRWFFL
ncbi:hypothetical protein J6590_074092 [Homalodisca vitripennis]|nr:hypothetical protein J6590_074092 [Homalodisca vitripennis]